MPDTAPLSELSQSRKVLLSKGKGGPATSVSKIEGRLGIQASEIKSVRNEGRSRVFATIRPS